MNNFSFTKTDSKIAKGIAVILMLTHHLFAYNRISGFYFTLLPRSPIDLLKILAEFGNICVSVFVFLSGYGIWIVSHSTNINTWRNKKLIRLILNYFLVFILFVPIGFLFFGRNFEWKEFILNLCMLSYSYNREWWFLRVYLELLLLSPIFIHLFKRNVSSCIRLSILLGFIGLLLHESRLYQNIMLQEFTTFFLWQTIFTLGIFCSFKNAMESVYSYLERHHLNNGAIYFILLIICILFRECMTLSGKIKDPVIILFFVLFSVLLVKSLHLGTIMAFIGQYSLNIWLIHTFFCYYYTPDLVMWPRNSLLILIWLLCLSLVASFIISFLYDRLSKGLAKNKWKIRNYIQKSSF